jgi:hypothetical protein
MAEHQLPKLTVRVRFPSSARMKKVQVGDDFRTLGLRSFRRLIGCRAISVPLASGPGRIALVVELALLVFDVGVDGVGYRLVRAARLVLVDHGGPFGVVAHARHQVSQACAAVGGELVSGVAEVVVMPTSA